ncbi:MAG: hypothetical protein ACKV2T_42655 [Kofleriaceae bacterium]
MKILALVVAVGCGASAPPPAGAVPGTGASPSNPNTTTSSTSPSQATPSNASPSNGEFVSAQSPGPPLPPPPKLAFEGVIVEGSLDAGAAAKQLERYGPQIGACVGDGANATATEIMVLVTDDKVSLRSAWRDGAPSQKLVDCLAPVMPDGDAAATARTDVYVVVTVTPDGTIAKVPAPPVRKKSFEDMFCKLDTLAGADKLPVEKRRDAMITWARTNVRHPAPFSLAAKAPTWAPQDVAHNLKKGIQAEGIKKCPMQRW